MPCFRFHFSSILFKLPTLMRPSTLITCYGISFFDKYNLLWYFIVILNYFTNLIGFDAGRARAKGNRRCS